MLPKVSLYINTHEISNVFFQEAINAKYQYRKKARILNLVLPKIILCEELSETPCSLTSCFYSLVSSDIQGPRVPLEPGESCL